MDELIKNTINDINEKLGWANRSFDKLKKNRKEKNEIHDNFWAFLTAFQQTWYYYNRLIKELTPNLSKEERKKLSFSLINNWKINQLTESERFSWDLLQKLRNDDAHRVPVKANYEIKVVFLTDFDDTVFTDYDGTPFCEDSEEISVIFNEKEYNIEYLAKNGIESINKLIKYLPNIKNNWC
jgi:hypothetical protein